MPKPLTCTHAHTRARAWLSIGFALCAMGTTATWSAVAQCKGVPVNAASVREKMRAKGPYTRAMQAFDGGNFEAALQGFQESYDIVASPNSHLMIVRTLSKLGLAAEAYAMLHDVIAEAEAAQDTVKYGKTAEAARAEQEQLRSQLALVTVDMAAAAVINGQLIPPQRWGKPIPVEPGELEIVLRTPDGRTERKKITLKVGEATTVSPAGARRPRKQSSSGTYVSTEPVVLEAEPAVQPSGISHRTLAFVAGGVGLAGMAAFTIFGLANNAQFADLESKCGPDRVCPESLASSAETGRTYQTLANVGLGVGVVGIGAAVALWLTKPAAPQPEAAASSGTPQLMVGPRGVAVAGTF